MTETEKTTTDPAELRAEIAELRADLGDTVEALAAKTDVKAQAKATVDRTTTQVKERLAVQRARARVQADRGRAALARYSPWPQVALGSVAALAAAVLGTRAVRRSIAARRRPKLRLRRR